MRSGSLIHPVEIYRLVQQQSDSGATSKVRTKVMDIRCMLVKQNGSYIQTTVDETDKLSIVLETWLITDIKDTDTLCFSGQEFKITLLQYDYPTRTMKIYATKINK